MNLADERLRPLWVAAHRRLERGAADTQSPSFVVRRPSDDERSAIDRLLGRRSRGRDLRVRLAELEDVLARLGTTVCEVTESVVGPVRDRCVERAASAARDAKLWSAFTSHDALEAHADLRPWLDDLRSSGRWRRLDHPETDIDAMLEVLVRLPAPTPIGRSRLAADTLGASHALDDTEPAGRLVFGALAYLSGVGAGQTSRGLPGTANDRRTIWAEFGVEVDDTSSTVLTANLRPAPAGPVTEAAGRWADSSVPLVIPLAAVDAEAWTVVIGSQIWICENPAVLSAGASTGRPLICIEGQPSAAAIGLLGSLTRCGARLSYHGDFGVGGIAIANSVIATFGADPWRMSVNDHREALAGAPPGARLPALRGAVPEAVWDADLAGAINDSGVEIEEELVLDDLIEDLERGAVG